MGNPGFVFHIDLFEHSLRMGREAAAEREILQRDVVAGREQDSVLLSGKDEFGIWRYAPHGQIVEIGQQEMDIFRIIVIVGVFLFDIGAGNRFISEKIAGRFRVHQL